MKIIILNGSPRLKGNTNTVVNQMKDGFIENNHGVEVINVAKKNVKGCDACDYCHRNNGVCIHKDDTNNILNKIISSDLIIFATPVYWWGITAQLKSVVDKFYANQTALKNKKYGLVAIGGDGLENIQYELISSQFKSIANFLSWEQVFDTSETAYEAHEIRSNSKILEKYKNLALSIK